MEKREKTRNKGLEGKKNVSALLDLGLPWKETAVIRLEGAFSIPQKKRGENGDGLGHKKKGWGWGT